MTRQGTPDGTPSLGEVEGDFTVPDDADLRPVHDGHDLEADDEEDGS